MKLILIGLSLWCSSPANARADIPFDGMVELRKERLFLRVGAGDTNAVEVGLQLAAKDTVAFSVDFRHVQLSALDLAMVLQGQVQLTGTGPHQWEAMGDVVSRYTLLNRKPVRDLSCKFFVQDGKLVIERLWLGSISVNGQIDLQGEYRSNLSVELVASDLEQVCGLFQNTGSVRTPTVTGTLTGALLLTGPFWRPVIKGRLAAYDGCFNALCYESILLQLEGEFPNIRLDDSVVTHADGYSFNLAGAVDLSDLERLPFQVRQLRKVPVVSAAKNRREWILKRQRSGSNRDAVTEMKYIWQKDDRGDAESVLGIEHKIGF